MAAVARCTATGDHERFDERAEISGRNVLARWTRTRSPQSATTVQVFADHTDRREHLLLARGEAARTRVGEMQREAHGRNATGRSP